MGPSERSHPVCTLVRINTERQCLHDTSRVAGHNGIWRDVLRDHRAGRDDRAVADRNALQDEGAAPDPHVVADDHRGNRLGRGRLARSAADRIDRVPVHVEHLNPTREQTVPPNSDRPADVEPAVVTDARSGT